MGENRIYLQPWTTMTFEADNNTTIANVRQTSLKFHTKESIIDWPVVSKLEGIFSTCPDEDANIFRRW